MKPYWSPGFDHLDQTMTVVSFVQTSNQEAFFFFFVDIRSKKGEMKINEKKFALKMKPMVSKCPKKTSKNNLLLIRLSRWNRHVLPRSTAGTGFPLEWGGGWWVKSHYNHHNYQNSTAWLKPWTSTVKTLVITLFHLSGAANANAKCL